MRYAPIPEEDTPQVTPRKCIVVGQKANGDVMVLPTRGKPRVMGFRPFLVLQPSSVLQKCANGNGPVPFKQASHFYAEKRNVVREQNVEKCLANIGPELIAKVRRALEAAYHERERRRALQDRGGDAV